jgi:uncharacterized membrane protein YkvI
MATVIVPQLHLKESFEKANIPFKGYIQFAFALNILVAALVLIFLKKLPPQIPLFYGMAEGEEQLTRAWTLIIPSFVALFILVVNSLLSSKTNDDFLKKVLIVAGLAATFFATITTIKIFFLVGNI